MRSATTLAFASLALCALGCEGKIGPGAGPSPGAPMGPTGRPDPTVLPRPIPVAPSFPCDPSASPTTSATPLRRLSTLQYQNTLRDLFADQPSFDPLQVAGAALARMPPDDVGAGFKGMDARLSDRHAQAYYEVADALATAITTDDVRLTRLATSCAMAVPTTACIDGFLDTFAKRAYRRPLLPDERDRYRALDDGTRDGRELFRSLVFSLLMAPQFIYHAEVDGTGSPDALALSPFELASRLSFHFWQSMPDSELLDAAADGSLSTPAGYEAQVERLVASSRTEDTVRVFYREWFQLGSIASFRRGAAFDAFSAGEGLDEPGADHLEAAAREIEDLTRHYTFGTDGTMRDLLLTDLSFNRSPYLAGIYGTTAWDGASEATRLPSAERSGILTRAAFLVSGTHNTHPIHRGAVVRRRIMCQTLTAPDPGALPPGSLVPPPPDPSQTTRQRFANKVLNEPCATCHTQMNPIGYVLERYDAMGRFRLTEHIYDEATGAELNALPIDSKATPRIGPDPNQEIETGTELSQAVADSGLAEPCFARQYFRFTYHREETTVDSCALEGVRVALKDGNLRQALKAIAHDPSFKTRKVE